MPEWGASTTGWKTMKMKNTQTILQNISSRSLNHFKGRVQDRKGNGIEFATVALVDTSGVVIAGTALRQDSDECVGTRCGTDR